jgi:hypothetical protein
MTRNCSEFLFQQLEVCRWALGGGGRLQTARAERRALPDGPRSAQALPFLTHKNPTKNHRALSRLRGLRVFIGRPAQRDGPYPLCGFFAYLEADEAADADLVA